MESIPSSSAAARRIEEIAALPHRNRVLHWVAFAASALSFGLMLGWILRGWPRPGLLWVALDIGLSGFFALDFITRSGFTRKPVTYSLTHFFDFIATVPAWALVHFGVPFVAVYASVILVARAVRAIDRLLGDWAVERAFLSVVEGIEEEITSRVFVRIVDRFQASLDRGNLTHALAESLARSKGAVLERVKASNPHQGIGAELAHIAGLDVVLERAEARTYDAAIEVLGSPEVDRATRDAIDATLNEMKAGMAVKTWRQRMGIGQARSRGSGEKS